MKWHMSFVIGFFSLIFLLGNIIPASAALIVGEDRTTVVVCDQSYIEPEAVQVTSANGLVISTQPTVCESGIPNGYDVVGVGTPVVDGSYTHTRYSISRRVSEPVSDVVAEPIPSGGGLVPEACSGTDGGAGCPDGEGEYRPDGYGSCEFVSLINNVIQFLIKMSALLAVLVFVYAGFVMVSSRGDSALISGAKKMFSNVIIGFVILLAAFLIINTIIGILVGGAAGGITWQTIECQYANKSADAADIDLTLEIHERLTIEEVDAIVATYDQTLLTSSAGVCTDGKIEDVWGSLAGAANCIITAESSCGASPISRTDVGADGNPFSFGVMQINTTVHEVKGCGHLGISDMRCLDAWSGKNYSAKVSDTSLYNACRDALLNPECNMINGKRIYAEAGNRWRPWSTAAQCGLR